MHLPQASSFRGTYAREHASEPAKRTWQLLPNILWIHHGHWLFQWQCDCNTCSTESPKIECAHASNPHILEVPSETHLNLKWCTKLNMPYLLRDRSKTKRNNAKYIPSGWVGWRDITEQVAFNSGAQNQINCSQNKLWSIHRARTILCDLLWSPKVSKSLHNWC